MVSQKEQQQKQQQQQQNQQQKQKQNQQRRPPEWKVWLIASRPHTLTASISPVIVGGCVTYHYLVTEESLSLFWNCTVSWALFCMLIQLGTNLHNDYADFIKGADTEKRVGQARATQKGWVTPFQTACASTLVLGLAFLLGCGFVHSAMTSTSSSSSSATSSNSSNSSNSARTGLMIFIVVSSIFNAFAYTGGPYPLGYIGLSDFSIGYYGLGDLFVFLYFGLVATLTLPFLYLLQRNNNGDITTSSSSTSIGTILYSFVPYAIQVACLATNIIVVNNLRDRHTDVLANKRTLAVRFGATFCKLEYATLVGLAYLLILVEMYFTSIETGRMSWIGLLPFLTLPLAYKELQALYSKTGSALNPHVGGTAKVQFFFCILLGISICWS